MADITGRRIETIDHPQDAAAGAVLVCAVGLRILPSFRHVKRKVPVRQVYLPESAVKEMFDRQYRVFTNLYRTRRKNVAVLNRKGA